MVSLWGSKKTDDQEDNIDEENQETGSMSNSARPGSRNDRDADERTQLLQPNRQTPRGAYLAPDDPAVSTPLGDGFAINSDSLHG